MEGSCAIKFESVGGDAVMVTRMEMNARAGTHVDAPAHYVRGLPPHAGVFAWIACLVGA